MNRRLRCLCLNGVGDIVRRQYVRIHVLTRTLDVDGSVDRYSLIILCTDHQCTYTGFDKIVRRGRVSRLSQFHQTLYGSSMYV